ncbi:hypothetical protein [uncultured Ilumatobacter sp.]|jgi:hypothetical protein|uniref:hypothetical protein n=1 Tax=uncultured Ilumatobacter sp. TaxID=879968 RepID=UPI00374E37C9|tara:strand:+ start:626 stop:811 length:186 start_codon:yes stop_codon:yes gene_type:complete
MNPVSPTPGSDDLASTLSDTIQVDREVWSALDKEAKRTAVGANLVLRRLLKLDDPSHGGHG